MKLSLHRSGKRPDWLKTPPERRNHWQRLAHRTHGIVTPANFVTLIGCAIAVWGIGMIVAGHFWWAGLLLVVGRLLDIADGVIADQTGTKSSLGETLDATVDKIVTGLTIIALFVAHVAPAWLLGLFILPHLIISIIVIIGETTRVRIHPSRLGKTTMLLAWIAIAAILLVRALHLSPPHPLVDFVYIFTLISSAFGFITAYSYLPKSK